MATRFEESTVTRITMFGNKSHKSAVLYVAQCGGTAVACVNHNGIICCRFIDIHVRSAMALRSANARLVNSAQMEQSGIGV